MHGYAVTKQLGKANTHAQIHRVICSLVQVCNDISVSLLIAHNVQHLCSFHGNGTQITGSVVLQSPLPMQNLD
jgi:hypothetical protein